MKRTELAITLILALLLSLFAGVPAIKEAKANPYGMTLMMWRDKIVVETPQNKTYNTETLAVNFTVEYMEASYTGYILNNQKPVYVSPTVVSHETDSWFYVGQFNFLLTNLTDGTYNLTLVRSRGLATVLFSIDATPPNISVLTLENKMYDTSDLQLNFTVDESVSQITYSLDEQGNVTITGNTTLTDLSYGSHTLTVYANDIAGNTGISETITFNIREPFSAILAVAPIASMVAIGLCLLIYFTKIKKTTGKTEE